MLNLRTTSEGRGGVTVSTSARKAGGPWFDIRSGHDQFCASISIGLFTFLHRASLNS